MRRLNLFATTAVVILAAGLASTASADGPAVSQTNFTFDAGGGEIDHHGTGFAEGTVTTPIGHSLGFQLDGALGNWQGKAFEGVGAHLFWRDPSVGLLGLYGEYLNTGVPTNVGGSDNSDLVRAALEAELYAGPFALEGRAGWEGGSIGTHFYDRANIAFYPVDNVRFAVGQIEEAGRGFGTIMAEFQPDEKLGATFYAEALESHNIVSAFGGVRFYFGGPSKSLKDHARQDDPETNIPEDLLGIAAGQHHNAPVCRNFEGQVIPCGQLD
jgi:hypothetical protein